MGLHDPLGDGQAEAEAMTLLAGGLPVTIENMRKVRALDAGAGVLYAELDLARQGGGAERDASARRRELEGVAEQVRKDLMNSVAVAGHGSAPRERCAKKLTRFGGGERRE